MDTIEELNKLIEYKGKRIQYLIDKDKEFWFYGKDVASILGYNNNDSIKSALQNNIDKENKCNFGNLQFGATELPQVKFDSRTVFISEIGLYLFAFSSKAPLANEFKLWAANVIKELRKYGEYKITKEKDIVIKNREDKIDELLKALAITNSKLDDIKEDNKEIKNNNQQLLNDNVEIKNKLGIAIKKVPRAANIIPQHLLVIKLKPFKEFNYYCIRGQKTQVNKKKSELEQEYPDLIVMLRLINEPNPIKFKQDLFYFLKEEYGDDFKNKLNYFNVDNITSKQLKEFIIELHKTRGDELK